MGIYKTAEAKSSETNRSNSSRPISVSIPSAPLPPPSNSAASAFGWLDSLWGLIPVYMSYMLPLCVWLMRGFFAQVVAQIGQISERGRFIHQHVDRTRGARSADRKTDCTQDQI